MLDQHLNIINNLTENNTRLTNELLESKTTSSVYSGHSFKSHNNAPDVRKVSKKK